MRLLGRAARLLGLLALLPVLSACVNDGAAYEIDGSDHALSLMREQPWPWSRSLKLYVVVARMPHCMRRHPLPNGTTRTKVEIWQVPSGAYIVKQGKRLFVTETQTCTSFAPLDAPPAEGLGSFLGVFAEQDGKFVFTAAAQPPAEEPEAQ